MAQRVSLPHTFYPQILLQTPKVKLIRPALKPGDQQPLRFGNGPGAKEGDLVTVVKVRKDRQCVTGFRVCCINTVTGRGLKLDSSFLLPHPNDGTGEIARLKSSERTK